MLRLLEYYSGCLFLRSNHAAGSINAAIISRITVMLSYPPLDADGRAKVWGNLMELVPARPGDLETDNPPLPPGWRAHFLCPRGGGRISFAFMVAAAAALFLGWPSRSRRPRGGGRISLALVVAGSSLLSSGWPPWLHRP